ncbi:hypothetical protein [Gemmatirosa kalamazoonensis]|jgi:hypothetical protein|nr:hypothetical protein [Gemmatirosa kalamazoonensis]
MPIVHALHGVPRRVALPPANRRPRVRRPTTTIRVTPDRPAPRATRT